MALTEGGTHALVVAAFGAVAVFGEHKLARRLLAFVRPDVLLVADRDFAGYELWGLARATGALLAWRIKKNLVFVALRVLSDGSYLSVMRTLAEDIRHGQVRAVGLTLHEPARGYLVRVMACIVTIRPRAGLPRTETFWLVISLLDAKPALARQLAAVYHQRWAIENGFAELKNRVCGAGFILCSRAPELICREIYALLTVYQALCALQARAAEQGGTDPDRISFTVTVRLARLAVAAQVAADQPVWDAARHEVITELLAALLPPRRNWQCQRACIRSTVTVFVTLMSHHG